jgi:hypothetical protein
MACPRPFIARPRRPSVRSRGDFIVATHACNSDRGSAWLSVHLPSGPTRRMGSKPQAIQDILPRTAPLSAVLASMAKSPFPVNFRQKAPSEGGRFFLPPTARKALPPSASSEGKRTGFLTVQRAVRPYSSWRAAELFSCARRKKNERKVEKKGENGKFIYGFVPMDNGAQIYVESRKKAERKRLVERLPVVHGRAWIQPR